MEVWDTNLPLSVHQDRDWGRHRAQESACYWCRERPPATWHSRKASCGKQLRCCLLLVKVNYLGSFKENVSHQ